MKQSKLSGELRKIAIAVSSAFSLKNKEDVKQDLASAQKKLQQYMNDFDENAWKVRYYLDWYSSEKVGRLNLSFRGKDKVPEDPIEYISKIVDSLSEHVVSTKIYQNLPYEVIVVLKYQ